MAHSDAIALNKKEPVEIQAIAHFLAQVLVTFLPINLLGRHN